MGHDVLRQNPYHGLVGHLVHGVRLVVTAGQIAEHVERQLVNPLDDRPDVLLEVVCVQHVPQGVQLKGYIRHVMTL